MEVISSELPRNSKLSDSVVSSNIRPYFILQKAQWHYISIRPVPLRLFQNNLYLRAGVCTAVGDGVGADKVGTKNNNNKKIDTLLSKAIIKNLFFYLQTH